jgi:carbon storage regulator
MGNLILSRKEGQKVIIGEGVDAIKVTVRKIRGGQVSLGVDAPRDVPIWRPEVVDLREEVAVE